MLEMVTSPPTWQKTVIVGMKDFIFVFFVLFFFVFEFFEFKKKME
jgi:hypothetical protein